MPSSRTNDDGTSPESSATKRDPPRQPDPDTSNIQHDSENQESEHQDIKPNVKQNTSSSDPISARETLLLKDLTKDELYALIQKVYNKNDNNQGGDQPSYQHDDQSNNNDADNQSMYNDYDRDEDEYNEFERWRATHLASSPRSRVSPSQGLAGGGHPARQPSASGRGGFGGPTGGRGGYPPPPPRGSSNTRSMPAQFHVKNSTMGVRPVPRGPAQQGLARVQLSKYDRGTGTTLIKNMEHATKPIVPKLAVSNYSKLLSMSFDSNTVGSDNVHLWQESIRQIYDRAYDWNILPIFMIPDIFDLYTLDSPDQATKIYNGILDFNNPDLTDDIYFKWQTYVRIFGADADIQSDIWMEKMLKSFMEPDLYAMVIIEYDELPEHQRGSISLFRLIVNRMVNHSEEARRHLLRFLEEFDIRHYPGENVSLACVRLKEVSQALGVEYLPRDLLSKVLEGFEKSSTDNFRQVCVAMRLQFLCSFTKSTMATMSLNARFQHMLKDLEGMYLDLKTGGKWEGSSNESTRQASTFNVVSSNDDDTSTEEYAIYQASGAATRMPFKEWVKTATCRYCHRTGHIRPDCRKRKADVKRGIYAQVSPDIESSSDLPAAASNPSPSPSPSNASPSNASCLRTHTRLKALKAALDSLTTDGDSQPDESTATDVLDEDVSELMCALGLKD